jgi:sortase A
LREDEIDPALNVSPEMADSVGVMVRRVVAGFGRSLITVGVLLLFFVAYQLWGTGIAQARLQDKASKDFEQLLSDFGSAGELPISDDSEIQAIPTEPVESTLSIETGTDVVDPALGPGTPSTKKPKPTTKPKPVVTTTTLPKVRAGRTKMERPKPGKALGLIVIKRIGLKQTVVEGSDKESLKTGPGHYPTTPMPGQPGNSAIACHRTTYGAPCFNLDLVREGDEILVQTLQGKFRYVTERQWTVKPKGPEATAVLAPTPGENVLTLTTCEPKYSAKLRRIVRARLVGPAADEDFFEAAAPPPTVPATVPEPTEVVIEPTEPEVATTKAGAGAAPVSSTPVSTSTTTTAPELATEETEANVVEAEGAAASLQSTELAGSGPIRSFFWFRGRQSVWLQALFLGAVCGAIWIGAWVLARRRKLLARGLIYTASFLFLFGPVLFFCFEHIAKLLPESV